MTRSRWVLSWTWNLWAKPASIKGWVFMERIKRKVVCLRREMARRVAILGGEEVGNVSSCHYSSHPPQICALNFYCNCGLEPPRWRIFTYSVSGWPHSRTPRRRKSSSLLKQAPQVPWVTPGHVRAAHAKLQKKLWDLKPQNCFAIGQDPIGAGRKLFKALSS